jgi:hypothetical protein
MQNNRFATITIHTRKCESQSIGKEENHNQPKGNKEFEHTWQELLRIRNVKFKDIFQRDLTGVEPV